MCVRIPGRGDHPPGVPPLAGVQGAAGAEEAEETEAAGAAGRQCPGTAPRLQGEAQAAAQLSALSDSALGGRVRAHRKTCLHVVKRILGDTGKHALKAVCGIFRLFFFF